MASVRIEDVAFSDLRYERLAKECGLSDADHALGKMARLWRQCTIEQSETLEGFTVETILGNNGIGGLVTAQLGELVEGGEKVRIRGTKGRIEWLSKLKNNGKYGALGGRPKGNKQETHLGLPNLTPLSLAKERDKSLSRRSRKRPDTPLPADWQPNESHSHAAAEAGVDRDREAAKFRDHALAADRRAADWNAAFRNWLRKAGEFATKPANGANGSADAKKARMREIAESLDRANGGLA